MFESIKNFFAGNWKKLLVALGAAIVSFFLLKFILAPFLGLTVVATVGALLIGYLVWSRVALWEIQALAKKVGINL
jgi:uncharacterized protein involved in cysteine biosynthesis